MSKLSELEIRVLEVFCESFPEYFGRKIEFHAVGSCERSFSGQGFMTELPNISELQTASYIDRLVWDKATAMINDETLVGFLVYLEDGKLTAVEGFTFGEDWPEEIGSFQIYIE
ncbi:hypothetical protein [Leisingera sp. ANG-M7]|uniref:hypothetical protein n=1 Tax=Leisingera sp. ANG-M7 TaxID=1577902 RepID=UPI00057C48E4|nr:hypothetical protein [Leisingera sp. ANG-M7]KIC32364.1 hypothetical protein RA26_21705 [Leisingera sp. ANG-M7]